MNPGMMRVWLAEQAKKAMVSPAQIQRKRLGINEGFFTVTQPRQQLKQPLSVQAPTLQQQADATRRQSEDDLNKKMIELTGKPLDRYKTGMGGPLGAGGGLAAVGGESLVGIGGPDVTQLQKLAFARSAKVTQYDQHWDPKTRKIVRTQRELTPGEIHARGFDDPDKRGFTSLFKKMQTNSFKKLKKLGDMTWFDEYDFQNSPQWRNSGRLGDSRMWNRYTQGAVPMYENRSCPKKSNSPVRGPVR